MAEENSRLMNTRTVMFASAVRAAATNGGVFESVAVTNHNAKGGIFYLDITAEVGTATLNIKMQGQDPVSKDWYDLADDVLGTGAYVFPTDIAAVTTGPTVLTVYHGLSSEATKVCNGILPQVFRAHATVAGSSSPSFTFSLAVELID